MCHATPVAAPNQLGPLIGFTLVVTTTTHCANHDVKSCGRAVHCELKWRWPNAQEPRGLFVLKAGRARGAFFELKLKTCPEVGVTLTPLRRDTFSMVLVLPDTGEYEPQALYIITI